MSKIDEKVEELKSMLEVIELDVTTEGLRLSDAIRMGSKVTGQAFDWSVGDNACALSAAVLSAKALGIVE